MPLKEDDAHDERVGMLHFLNGLRAPFFRELLKAPIFHQAVVHPELAYRRQLVLERLVQTVDDHSTGILVGMFLSARCDRSRMV